MKYRVVFLLWLSLPFPGSLAASFDAAAAAYRSGSFAAAFDQFKPLAETGDARAQAIVAMMYKYGEGVEQDWTASYNWYRRAAEAGYVPAQYALGDMLAEGRGVTADHEQAVEWLTRAAQAGFPRANARLNELRAGTVQGRDGDDRLIVWANRWQPQGTTPAKASASAPAKVPEIAVAPQHRDAPPAAGDYRVQLAALGSEQGARRAWDLLVARSRGMLAADTPILQSKRIGERTMYVVQIGPFPSLLAARKRCTDLQAGGVDCFALRSLAE